MVARKYKPKSIQYACPYCNKKIAWFDFKQVEEEGIVQCPCCKSAYPKIEIIMLEKRKQNDGKLRLLQN